MRSELNMYILRIIELKIESHFMLKLFDLFRFEGKQNVFLRDIES